MGLFSFNEDIKVQFDFFESTVLFKYSGEKKDDLFKAKSSVALIVHFFCTCKISRTVEIR